MARPRRVPWGSKTELIELYNLLFSPDSDASARSAGLARINVYLSSPSCPAFLPLLHSLISAAERPEPTSAEEKHSVRLVCAMAVVRFVNGMVDPLQTGPYARPISHIAASIGIPPSLISLRHRATHEDLPPLPMLRQAITTAITYLHDYAFLPLISDPASSSHSQRHVHHHPGQVHAHHVDGRSSEAERLLKRWKRVMKARVREKEVGEESVTGREVRVLKKALETVDEGEVVDALVKEGGLIPLGIKKRPSTDDLFPSPASQQVWLPLLDHLVLVHPALIQDLSERIVDEIVAFGDLESRGAGSVSRYEPQISALSFDPSQRGDSKRESISRNWSLSTWLLLLWSRPSGDALALGSDVKRTLWQRILNSLIDQNFVLRTLYEALLEVDDSLRPLSAAPLLSPPQQEKREECADSDEDMPEDSLRGLEVPQDDQADEQTADDLHRQLSELERRVDLLEGVRHGLGPSYARKATSANPIGHQASSASDGNGIASSAIPGWRRLATQEWRPCPIGVWGRV